MNDSFIASKAVAPRSATSAGANQFSIANTAAMTRISSIVSRPVPVIARADPRNASNGSPIAPMRATSASFMPPMTPATASAPMPSDSAMLTAPMIINGTKCTPWKPSKRCATRSGSLRSMAAHPSMRPPMNTGVSSQWPTSPTYGIWLISTVMMM